MGLNFLGLGFSLGAQDKGLAGAIKETSSGLADISKSVVGIGLASAKMIFKTPDFKPAIALTQQLANDVKLTTTNMEQYGVAAEKVTSEGLAGLDLTEKALNKAKGQIASIAFSMNVPVENVTRSFSALTQAGIDTNDMLAFGFKDLKQYQQLMEVTGANGEDFAAALGTMNKQMGMSKKQIKGSVQAVAAIGKSMNIGKQAISGMAETVKVLNANSNLLPHSWSPARMDKFLKGTTIVSGALTGIGMKADDAMAASRELTQALLKGQKNISSLYSGLTDDLGLPMEVLTQNLGNVDDAWAMLQESPDQFMLKMGKLVKDVKGRLKPEAFDRFRLQMEGAFGPQVMAAFQQEGFGRIQPMIEKANKAMADGGKAIDDMAKKHRDGRTYAERFAIAQDMIQTRLKKVKGVMGDGQYLKEYVKQGKEFTDWANATAAKGGPLGKLTTALIEVKNRGFGGFLASHSQFGFAIAEGIKMMEPLMQYLPALKVAFLALMSPIGMVAAAVAGLYFAFKDLGKGSDSILRPFLNKMVEEAPKFISKVMEIAGQIFDAVWRVLSNVDWAGVMETVGNAFTRIFSSVFAALDKIDWNKVGQVLGIMLSKAAEIAIMILKGAIKLGERILNWLDSVDWGGVGKKAGHYFAMIGEVVLGAIVKVIRNLPDILVKIFKHAANFIIGALDGIKNYLIKKFPSAAKPIEVIFGILKGIVKIVSGALQIAFKVIGAILSTIWSIVKGIFNAIGWVVNKVAGPLKFAFGLIKDAVLWIWDKLKSVGRAIGSVVGKIGGALSKVGGLFSGIGSGIKSLFSSSSKDGNQFWKDFAAKQKAMTEKIKAEAKRRHAEWVKSEHAAGRATEGFVKTVEGQIIKASDALVRYEKDATGVIKKVAHDASKYVKGLVGGEAFVELEAMQDEIRKTNEIAKKTGKSGSDEWHKAMDDAIAHAGQLHADFQKKWNVRWDLFYHANERVKEQFAVQEDVYKKAQSQGVGYYTALKSLQFKLGEQLGTVVLKMEQLRAKGKEGTEEFKQLQAKYEKMGAEGLVKLNNYQDIISGNISKTIDKLANSAEGLEQKALAAERAAYVLAEVYKAEMDEMMKKLPETATKTIDVVKQMTNELAEAQRKEVENFISTTDKKGAALDAAIKEIEKKYKDRGKEITDTLAKYNENLVVGSEEGALRALDKIKQANAGMLKEVDTKTKQAATEIQKHFGVTGEAALESVNQIAAVDPKTFKRNMGVVKDQFMTFLRQMDKEGKKLLDNTTKSFNKLWETLDGGFKKNKSLMEDFGKAADAVLTSFWNSVVDKATRAATQIVDITKGIGVALKAMAKSINLMDLLASPDQITQWAAAVVSALSHAFRTGGAADAMISASYSRALQMAADIQKNAGPATPETAPAKSSATSSAITAAQELLRVINRPAWADDPKSPIPRELAEINANLKTLIETTGAMAAGKATSPRKSSAPKPGRA